MSEERCSTCRYLFPIKELVNGKWLYGNCCAVFPVTEPDDEYSFAMFVRYPEKDRCEMYTARGSSKFNVAPNVTGDGWRELDAVALSEEDTGVFDE